MNIVKTKLTPKLMTELGFWQGGYTSIWYHGEYGVIDENTPTGIYIENCERPRYRDILGETVFCCQYVEDLQEFMDDEFGFDDLNI